MHDAYVSASLARAASAPAGLGSANASPAALTLGLFGRSARCTTRTCRPHSLGPRRPLRGLARLTPRPRPSLSASLVGPRDARRLRVGLTRSGRGGPCGAWLG